MTPASETIMLLYRRWPVVQIVLLVLLVVCGVAGMIASLRATSPNPLPLWVAWAGWLGMGLVTTLNQVLQAVPRKVQARLQSTADGKTLDTSSRTWQVLHVESLRTRGLIRWILSAIGLFLVVWDVRDVKAGLPLLYAHEFWAAQIGITVVVGIQALASFLIRGPEMEIQLQDGAKRQHCYAWHTGG